MILGVGFPVALILSWAFDVTPEGLRPTQAAASQQPSTGVQRLSLHWLSHAGQLLILLAVAFLVADQSRPTAARHRSLRKASQKQRFLYLLRVLGELERLFGHHLPNRKRR